MQDGTRGDMTHHNIPQQPTAAAPLREGPGTLIGPYKLLQLIGEGGFGSVFLAQQSQPVQRQVALKIIKLGMDTDQVVARFGQDRQALAMMDHPNIARVIDAGATDTGRPYFVMELVKGEPIVHYCDHNKLSIPERLELFAQVCQAVQHAHTKGIIHRDIKPSNILITMQDGNPITKIIDFGIAKATASKLAEHTVFTEHHQLIGTPEYMSPEQAEGLLDIDTRTDVYSLGVLLYELLTGTTPFSSKTLRSAAHGEIQRIIREVEPPKPSTRISQSSDTIANVAARRHTEPTRLGIIIRGELDWIVMKSLEKDRTRRYETAIGLATDIRRYLSGEAVLAAPPSTAYRLKKFVRRNRAPVFAAAAVLVALIAGITGTAWQAREAARERDAARESERQQALLREKADALAASEASLRSAAEASQRRAELIADFMNNTLEGAGPSVALGRDTTMLKEMMDSAAARIEAGELKATPEAELRLRGTIGQTYRQLALYPEAAKMLEPAVALARSLHKTDHIDTANTLNYQAQLLHDRGELAKAESLYRESLDMKQRLLPGDHQNVAAGLNDLGSILKERGDSAGAEPFLRAALDMWRRLHPGDHTSVASGLNNLAVLLLARGDVAAAEPLHREALAMRKRLVPGDHPAVAVSLNNVANVLQTKGDLAGAEPLYREALAMRKRLFPSDHPDVAAGLNNLAIVLQARGDLTGAEPLSRECLEMRRRLFRGDHPDIAVALNTLSFILLARGDPAGAEPLAREGVAMSERLSGKNAFATANVRLKLGRALLALNRFTDAQAELLETERVLSTASDVPRGRHKQSIEALITLYESWDKAEPGKGQDARAAEWRLKLGTLSPSTPPPEKK